MSFLHDQCGLHAPPTLRNRSWPAPLDLALRVGVSRGRSGTAASKAPVLSVVVPFEPCLNLEWVQSTLHEAPQLGGVA